MLPLPPNGSMIKSPLLVRTLMYGIKISRGLVPKITPCPELFSSEALKLIKSVGSKVTKVCPSILIGSMIAV